MTTQHWKGPTIPSEGDDPILTSFPTMLDTAGIIRRIGDPASARALLSTLPDGTVTPTHPAYFDINGVFWVADGVKANGVWNLAPVSPREFYPLAVGGEKSFSFAKAWDVYVVATNTIPLRPYDRTLEIDASLLGQVTGDVDLGIHAGGSKRYVRWPKNQTSSQSLHFVTTIPAGQSTAIQLVVQGGSAGSSVSVPSSPYYGGLDVAASPIATA